MLNDWMILFRLVLAAIFSGMIGFEREFHGRAAGFRTHILLCVGSTLVMLTSMHIFDLYASRIAVDPARIAAGVITGIGFLGAGTIMHAKSAVRGLTTAASLWVVAGIGLAVGSGLYYGAFLTTLLTMVTLMIFSRIEHSMIRKDWYRTIIIDSKEGVGQLKAIREIFGDYRSDITDFEVEKAKDGTNMLLKVGLKLYETRYADRIIDDLAHLDGVKHVKWEAE
ncbi:MAG: MgtC/SapB family protein [Candidatus Omnitrophica bacterium]|nr:MgtC/SapB family protein [Candidatus Omnitrophota bacterium]